MDPKLRRRQITTTVTAWLAMGVTLALCERLVWPGMWSVTLVVWWGYLIISVLMLLRLLIHSWASRWSSSSLGVVWTFVGLGLVLLWSRPILARVGDALILNSRSDVEVHEPAVQDGPTAIRSLAPGTSTPA